MCEYTNESRHTHYMHIALKGYVRCCTKLTATTRATTKRSRVTHGNAIYIIKCEYLHIYSSKPCIEIYNLDC